MHTYPKTLVGALIACTLLLPAFSLALTNEELNAQISSILAQVAQLQAKIAINTAVSTSTMISATTPASVTAAPARANIVCPVFNFTLAPGARGAAVVALQNFFVTQGSLTADSITGFYGNLTQSAVQNFQAQQGIVASGSVATTGWGSVGKLTSTAIAQVCSTPKPVITAVTPTGSMACMIADPPLSNCSSGWKPIKDQMGCTVAYDCATLSPTVATSTQNKCPVYSLPVCATGSAMQSSGIDFSGCPLPLKCVSPTNVTSAPTIASVDGPATLNANQSGTWTVRASVPNQSNAAIRYSVKWGDEVNWAYSSANGAAPASSAITTSGTFTHTFNYGGNFTPVFTVSNDGGSASFTTSVQVSGGLINCPIYAQSSMIAACPVGQHWESSKPTYDANNCPMQYGGKCVPDVGACTMQQLLCPSGQHVVYDGCKQSCVPDVPTGTTFSASPTSGTVPLNVTVTRTQTASWCSAGQLNGLTMRPMDLGNTAIDFGDGSAVEAFDDCVTYKIHTYSKAGSYTIQTWGYGGLLPPNYVVQKTPVATINVIGIPLPITIY